MDEQTPRPFDFPATTVESLKTLEVSNYLARESFESSAPGRIERKAKKVAMVNVMVMAMAKAK